jgi:hypothetical protein
MSVETAAAKSTPGAATAETADGAYGTEESSPRALNAGFDAQLAATATAESAPVGVVVHMETAAEAVDADSSAAKTPNGTGAPPVAASLPRKRDRKPVDRLGDYVPTSSTPRTTVTATTSDMTLTQCVKQFPTSVLFLQRVLTEVSTASFGTKAEEKLVPSPKPDRAVHLGTIVMQHIFVYAARRIDDSPSATSQPPVDACPGVVHRVMHMDCEAEADLHAVQSTEPNEVQMETGEDVVAASSPPIPAQLERDEQPATLATPMDTEASPRGRIALLDKLLEILARWDQRPADGQPEALQAFVDVMKALRSRNIRTPLTFWQFLATAHAVTQFNNYFWDEHYHHEPVVTIGPYAVDRSAPSSPNPFETIVRLLVIDHRALRPLLTSRDHTGESRERPLPSVDTFIFNPKTDVIGVVFRPFEAAAALAAAAVKMKKKGSSRGPDAVEDGKGESGGGGEGEDEDEMTNDGDEGEVEGEGGGGGGGGGKMKKAAPLKRKRKQRKGKWAKVKKGKKDGGDLADSTATSIATMRKGSTFTEADLANRIPLFTVGSEVSEISHTVVAMIDTGRNGATATLAHFPAGIDASAPTASGFMLSKFFSSGFARDASGNFRLQQSYAEASWATTWGDLEGVHRKATQRCKEIMLSRSRTWATPLTADDVKSERTLPDGAVDVFKSLLAFCVRGKTDSVCAFMVKWLLHMASHMYLAHHPDGDLNDMNFVVLWGSCDDHTHLKLSKNCFPNKKLLEALTRVVPVLIIDEHLTSQACSLCGNNAGKVTQKHNSLSGSTNQRFLTCQHCTVVDCHGIAHNRVLDKDISACVVSERERESTRERGAVA